MSQVKKQSTNKEHWKAYEGKLKGPAKFGLRFNKNCVAEKIQKE